MAPRCQSDDQGTESDYRSSRREANLRRVTDCLERSKRRDAVVLATCDGHLLVSNSIQAREGKPPKLLTDPGWTGKEFLL